jgi:UDP-glucose 4-epimerase
MKSERMDEVYNISTGRQTKIVEIAKIIMEIMGKDLGVIYENLADDTLVTNRIGSTEKAERELGFTGKTTLEDGLAETVKWKMKLG